MNREGGIEKSFWSELNRRNRDKFLDWISEQCDRLLAIGSVLIAQVVFQLIQLFDHSDLWVILGKMTDAAEVVIFGAFLVSQIRRALLMPGKEY